MVDRRSCWIGLLYNSACFDFSFNGQRLQDIHQGAASQSGRISEPNPKVSIFNFPILYPPSLSGNLNEQNHSLESRESFFSKAFTPAAQKFVLYLASVRYFLWESVLYISSFCKCLLLVDIN